MACILGELENVLKKQLGNTKNSKEFKDGTTKAKERVAELSTLLNEVGAMKKAMQGQINTETNAANYDKPLADKIANKLQKLYSHIEVAYLNGQTEMRAVLEELSGGLTMFQLSNKRKQEFEQKLRKARPELADTKIDEVLKNIEQFSETESNGDEKLMKKLEILALHWTLKGNVILPEDGSKVMQALRIADKNKLDPFSYSNPNEITESFAKVEEKTKPLNPDDYLGKGYSNKQELAKGVVVYDVDDNDTGREISRAMIDTHFGKEANPWCLLARKNNSIAETAEYWYAYYPGDKKIAFRNGKLIAFYGDNQWWDRMDSPSRDIAIESKLEKDEEGRIPIQIEYVPIYSHEKWLNDSYAQKDRVVKFIRGNRNNGVYEEWASTSKNSNEELELKEIRKNGVLKYSKKITINHYDETQKVDISINAPISKDMEFENDISEYYNNEVIGEYKHSTDFVGVDLEKRTFSEIRIQSKSNSTPYSISVNEINMYKVNELRYYVTDSVGYPYEITKEKFDALFNEIKIGKTIKEYNSIIKELDNDLFIPFQKQDDIIKGAAVLSKNKILVDLTNRSTDTLAHEYAHFYIAGFRNTPIVQEAIKKWGSEEALVQAIGEETVAKKGNAYGFWKRFSKWLKDLVANLDKASKEDLVKALTDAFLTNADLNTDAKKTTSVDGGLVNNKGFNGYVPIKDTGGKGSVEGDAKDIAMREVADGFVGEISNGRLNNSSTGTSYNALKDNVSGPTSAGSITYHGAAEPSIVMLARNGSFRGKPLNSETKEAIEYYFQEGASFVVGDMPGVDSQFINYLDEIGASYKIYHTGNNPRIAKEDIKYQKGTKDNYKQEADIIVPTETFQKNVNRKIECKE